MNKKNQQGQSLFELIVAIGVIGIVLLAIVNLIGNAISANNYARNRTLGIRYTQEGLEWLRGERDTSWASFMTRAAGGSGRLWCISDLDWSHSGACSADAIGSTIFSREARLTLISPTRIQVAVSTAWRDGSGSHESRSTIIYSDWKTL
ncbi:MAG: hypothetical protein COU68_03095 [Candidatus Pacebacteria bacterium CG10_big_fil_rev_8_21_14_0_10_45_6]|nr:MAG: hypothetical protein COU68_03095 [Candidatus Pacebacteria bacterium CG10_big_fil_rev_8_21_14_0_10_45_6]